jgi:hypothetical protein
VDRDGDFRLTKDVFASALEELFGQKPAPPALLTEHSLDRIRDQHPSLSGFISNMIAKLEAAQKKSKFSPTYTHFGLDSEPSSLLEVVGPSPLNQMGNYLLVGTNGGSCHLFSLDTFKMVGPLYGAILSHEALISHQNLYIFL